MDTKKMYALVLAASVVAETLWFERHFLTPESHRDVEVTPPDATSVSVISGRAGGRMVGYGSGTYDASRYGVLVFRADNGSEGWVLLAET
jgi:hypothetical protein